MKKSKFEKIKIVFGIVLLLLALLGFIFEHLTNITLTIISIIILVSKIQELKKGKKTISNYLLIGVWILLTISIFLITIMDMINS